MIWNHPVETTIKKNWLALEFQAEINGAMNTPFLQAAFFWVTSQRNFNESSSFRVHPLNPYSNSIDAGVYLDRTWLGKQSGLDFFVCTYFFWWTIKRQHITHFRVRESRMVSFFLFAYKDGLGHCKGWYRSPQGALTHCFSKAPCSEGEALNVCFLLWRWLLIFSKSGGRRPSVGMVLFFSWVGKLWYTFVCLVDDFVADSIPLGFLRHQINQITTWARCFFCFLQPPNFCKSKLEVVRYILTHVGSHQLVDDMPFIKYMCLLRSSMSDRYLLHLKHWFLSHESAIDLGVYPNYCYPKFTINVHQPCTCSSGIPTAPCVLF